MRKILAALIVTIFALSIGTAFAKREECTVKTVEEKEEKVLVTMECKKDTELKDGDTVKVKAAKKQAIEGC